MNSACHICFRREWDGGHALNDQECSEPGESLCRAIGILRAIVPTLSGNTGAYRKVQAFLVEHEAL